MERLKEINPYLKLLPYFFFDCKHFENQKVASDLLRVLVKYGGLML